MSTKGKCPVGGCQALNFRFVPFHPALKDSLLHDMLNNEHMNGRKKHVETISF